MTDDKDALLRELRSEFMFALSSAETATYIGTTPEKALAAESSVKLRHWIARITAALEDGKEGMWVKCSKAEYMDSNLRVYGQSHVFQAGNSGHYKLELPPLPERKA